MGPRRGLLEALEESVLRRLVHRVGVVDDEHSAAGLEGRAGDLPDEVADLVDADLRLRPRATRAREPPALGEHQVGVETEVAPHVLVRVAVGLLAQVGEVGLCERRSHPEARPARAARLGRGRVLAQHGLRDGERERLLADAVRPREEHGRREPVPLQRARQDRPDALVAADVGEPQGAPSRTRPRAWRPCHSASATVSSGCVPSSRSHREGSSARSASKPARTRSWKETRSDSRRSCAPRRPTRARPDLDRHVDEDDQRPAAARRWRVRRAAGCPRAAGRGRSPGRRGSTPRGGRRGPSARGRAPAGSPRPRSVRGRRSRAAARSGRPSRGSRGRAARRGPRGRWSSRRARASGPSPARAAAPGDAAVSSCRSPRCPRT